MSQAISFRRNSSGGSNNTVINNAANHAALESVGSSFKAGDLAISPRWRNSPMSFKMGSLVGSLGTRLYPAPGCSPTPGLDLQDFKMGSISSSFDQSRLLAALSTSHTNEDGNSNYTCCGLPLNDLHALLDHFEESHVYVLDHHSLFPQTGAAATTGAPTALAVPAGAVPAYDDMSLGAMEMDQMNDLELDATDSPLGSGSSASSSQNSSPHMGSQAALAANGGGSMYPFYDMRNLMAASGVPTSVASGDASPSSAQLQQTQCIPPSLLFSPAGSPGPSSSRPGSGASTPAQRESPTMASQAPAVRGTAASGSAQAPSSPSSEGEGEGGKVLDVNLPNDVAAMIKPEDIVSGPGIVHPGPPPPTQAPTSFSKPFKCPTPNCNKSYKQANGLKYHMTHGQCCFLPKDPALEGLDEAEKDKVERPFGCGVGGCERRYKNMNGLRYHYQHSGAHGAVGLALLAAGTHSVQIAAHNAAIGRSAAKLAASRAGSSVPSTPGGSSRQGSHSRSSSIASSTASTNTIRPAPINTALPLSPSSPTRPLSGATTPRHSGPTSPVRTPGAPGQPTYAQSTYYSQQAAGYPYIPQANAAYPYLPATQASARGPVFPPSSATAYGNNGQQPQPLGAPFTYAAPQRPPPLLRANSLGGAQPVVGTSAVTAVSHGSPHGMQMEVDNDGDLSMQD